MIRVLIADDHAIVREGLKQVLAAGEGITMDGEAANGHEVMEQTRRDGPDRHARPGRTHPRLKL